MEKVKKNKDLSSLVLSKRERKNIDRLVAEIKREVEFCKKVEKTSTWRRK